MRKCVQCTLCCRVQGTQQTLFLYFDSLNVSEPQPQRPHFGHAVAHLSVVYSPGSILLVIPAYNSLKDICKQFMVTLMRFKIQEKLGVVPHT